MSNSNLLLAVLVTISLILALALWNSALENRLDKLEHKVNSLQTLQQEKLSAFSRDVHNMTSITELLEKQALILQEIERRTR